jgi:hypothetical protein
LDQRKAEYRPCEYRFQALAAGPVRTQRFSMYERNDFQLLWQDPQKDVYDRDQPVLEGLNEEFSIWQRRAFED